MIKKSTKTTAGLAKTRNPPTSALRSTPKRVLDEKLAENVIRRDLPPFTRRERSGGNISPIEISELYLRSVSPKRISGWYLRMVSPFDQNVRKRGRREKGKIQFNDATHCRSMRSSSASLRWRSESQWQRDTLKADHIEGADPTTRQIICKENLT